MAVYKSRRKDAAAQFVADARELRKATVRIARKFPTSYKYVTTGPLLQLASEVYMNALKGNSIYVHKDMSERDYRHIAVNGRYIRGYGVPKYASKATGTDAGTTGGETGGTGNTGAGTCKAGDIVNFTGGKHYTNANAASGTACKPGKAKVTQVYQPGKAKHPYHLVAVSGGGSTVYGWVDAADIGGSASGGTRTHTVVRGDTLWALASTYLGSGSRYKEIMRLNGLTSEIIHVGQVLKMPAK